MIGEQEFLARSLVTAAGLTPQSRARLAMRDTFRVGGPRIAQAADISDEKVSDVVTRYQPMPRFPEPKVTAMNREQGWQTEPES